VGTLLEDVMVTMGISSLSSVYLKGVLKLPQSAYKEPLIEVESLRNAILRSAESSLGANIELELISTKQHSEELARLLQKESKNIVEEALEKMGGIVPALGAATLLVNDPKVPKDRVLKLAEESASTEYETQITSLKSAFTVDTAVTPYSVHLNYLLDENDSKAMVSASLGMVVSTQVFEGENAATDAATTKTKVQDAIIGALSRALANRPVHLLALKEVVSRRRSLVVINGDSNAAENVSGQEHETTQYELNYAVESWSDTDGVLVSLAAMDDYFAENVVYETNVHSSAREGDVVVDGVTPVGATVVIDETPNSSGSTEKSGAAGTDEETIKFIAMVVLADIGILLLAGWWLYCRPGAKGRKVNSVMPIFLLSEDQDKITLDGRQKNTSAFEASGEDDDSDSDDDNNNKFVPSKKLPPPKPQKKRSSPKSPKRERKIGKDGKIMVRKKKSKPPSKSFFGSLLSRKPAKSGRESRTPAHAVLPGALGESEEEEGLL